MPISPKTGVGHFALSLLLGLIVTAVPVGAAVADQAPYIPQSSSVVLQRVPPTSDPAVKAIRHMRSELQADPHNRKVAEKLARAYINFGRHRGDARYLGYADGVISPWVKGSQTPVSIAIIKATLLQSRHHFARARVWLKQVIQQAPDNLQAWLTLASVALVQGDFPLARSACAHTLGAEDRLVSAGCIAQFAAVTGKADQADQLLTQILQEEPTQAMRKVEGSATNGVRAWALGLKADAAKRMGHNSAAGYDFRKALALTPGDNFLLADYADFLLDQGKPKQALAVVRGYRQSDTSFLRRVFAEQAMHSADARRDAKIMAERFRAMDIRGSHVYRREQVRFVLHVQHDPKRALKLAEQNWQVQRAPWDIRVFFAAALAAGKPEAALPAWKLYRKSGLQDPHIAQLARRLKAQLEGEAAR